MHETELHFRLARPGDIDRLQAIRRDAFAPIFASFRSILGPDLYELAQRRDDESQGELLESLLAADSGWEVCIAEAAGEVVGFVSVRLDHERSVGEVGLNAVDPKYAGRGIGTAMYDMALERMRTSGMKVATVATGGDPSHDAARRAYRKADFDRELPGVWMYRRL